MRTIIRIVGVLIAAIALVSCGDTLSSSGTGSTSSSSSSSSSSGGTTTTYSLTLAAGVSSLSAGGTTSVTATIKDSSGALYTAQPVDVTFTSTCVGQGLATIDSPVTAAAGTAIANYTAKGCSGSDTIVAAATVASNAVSATAAVTVQAPVPVAIQYVSSTPAEIGLKGYGLAEASVVKFQVTDSSGAPVAGQVVDFSLDSTTGGVSLTATSATSDNNGYASVTVNSGTVATTVRVTAALASYPTITTQSYPLVISTGIADQDSFSLAADKLNPEAWSVDGATVTLTVHAADHFNNPVPDGSAVYFTAEGGQVQSQCTTTNGACSVTWTSANPRPADGRVTVLATMKGEESFVDSNGNGVYDAGETFTDLPEAFRDDNEDGSYTAGVDGYFDDYNQNGIYDTATGKYKGVLCNSNCDTAKSIDVRAGVVLVMARSNLSVTISPSAITAPGSATLTICSDFSFNGVSDPNQMPPVGTNIKASVNGAGKILSASNFTVPNSNAQGCYTQYVMIGSTNPTTPQSGLLTVEVTTPKGLVTDTYVSVSDP